MLKDSPTPSVLLLALFASGGGVQASDQPLPIAVDPSDMTDQLVSIASGYTQLEKTAPAVTSVITARQIKEMGAHDLFDILRTIPGFFLGRSAIGVEPIVAVRGFSSSFNQNLLVMLDGIPQNEQIFGNRFAALGRIPLDLIERIEIMRGPGSALYGADAYMAVINIITYRTLPLNQKLTLMAGANRTRSARLSGGRTLSGVHWVGGLEYAETDGDEPYLAADAQTLLDSLFGTQASLAPGYGNTHQQQVSGLLNITHEPLGLMLQFSQSRNMGMMTGVTGALDANGHVDTSVIESTLRWGVQTQDWLSSATLSNHFLQYYIHDGHYFPNGAFGGLFPEGVLASTKFVEKRIRAQGKIEYTGWRNHALSVGFSLENGSMRLDGETRNYWVSNGLILPLGSLQDITTPSLRSLNGSHFTNDLQSFYVQDEWKIGSDWIMTGGLRYDHYSDYGDILSPRIGLVWSLPGTDLTLKALYGRGFRGTSLLDREAINVPSIRGNSTLKPEKLDSYELVFDYRPRDDFLARLNLFYHQTTDQIRLQNSGDYEYRPENVGQQKGHGLELEARWSLTPQTKLYASYAYQQNTDETTGEDAGYSPHHLALFQLQHYQNAWFYGLQARYVGLRDRLAEDSSPRADTYTFVDGIVRYQVNPTVELGLEVRNLFNDDAKDARFGTGFPDDIALPGRTVYFSLTASF